MNDLSPLVAGQLVLVMAEKFLADHKPDSIPILQGYMTARVHILTNCTFPMVVIGNASLKSESTWAQECVKYPPFCLKWF